MHLPTLNALLNATAATLLIIGWLLIRSGRRRAHRAAMLSAFACSVAFLVSYLIYHYTAGSVRYEGEGLLRIVYFTVLLTHTPLAAAVPVLALITLNHGLKSRFDKHRRIARWTLPIWLYVSFTGVVVYWMLYRM